jgi:hypothetical protein
MFDPRTAGSMVGSVTFSGNIAQVFSTKNALENSDKYGIKDFDYDWKNNSGLESNKDSISYSGKTLSLNWTESGTGDNVRVLVSAVPEPEGYAMFLAGLGIIGAMVRRKAS